MTQVAKESISAAGVAASVAVASARSHALQIPSTHLKTPAVYLSRTIISSSRSLPLAATTTKLNISSDAMSPTDGPRKERPALKVDEGMLQERERGTESKIASQKEKYETLHSEDTLPVKDDSGSKPNDKPPEDTQATSDSASWLNWFSKTEQARLGDKTVAKPSTERERSSDVAIDRPQSTILASLKDAPPSPIKQRRNSDPNPASPKTQEEPPPRSWLSLWGNTTTQTATNSAASAAGVATDTAEGSIASNSLNKKSDEVRIDPASTPRLPLQPADTGKAYGWAFWSRDQSKDKDGVAQTGSKVGELALAGSPSQSKPEDAVVDEARGVANKVGKRQRPQSLGTPDNNKKPSITDQDTKKDGAPEAAPAPRKAKSTADAGSKAKRMPESLLLPSFRHTYSTAERPSLIQQLGRLLQLSPALDAKHVNIVPSPPRIKRALAIVSTPRVTKLGIVGCIANSPCLGCSRLLPCPINSLGLRSTNRNFYSLRR